jgi:hypothetical protein
MRACDDEPSVELGTGANRAISRSSRRARRAGLEAHAEIALAELVTGAGPASESVEERNSVEVLVAASGPRPGGAHITR